MVKEPDLEQIVGQAASYARDSMWPQAQLTLQGAQLLLLARIANAQEIDGFVERYWSRVLP